MTTIKKTVEKTKPTISAGMFENICNEILKYGYDIINYNKFLLDMKAINENEEVLKYHNSEIEPYYNTYLRKFSSVDTDFLYFEEFKIMTCNAEGTERRHTGYFAPMSFFDKIYSQKMKHLFYNETPQEREELRLRSLELIKKYKIPLND